MTARALSILHPGFEEIEAVTPIDLLSRADIEVVQAALDDQMLVSGRSGLTVRATHRLNEVEHFIKHIIALARMTYLNKLNLIKLMLSDHPPRILSIRASFGSKTRS